MILGERSQAPKTTMRKEDLHRGIANSERTRSGWGTAHSGKVIAKRRPKLGRVAESLQRWNEVLGVVRRRDAGMGFTPKSSRYLSQLYNP